MALEERRRAAGVPLAGLPEHPPHGLVDEILVVGDQALRDPERVVDLPPPDEGVRAQDRGAPFHRSIGRRELVEDVPRLVVEVLADHPDRRSVDEVPRVDQVVPAQVELEELASSILRGLLATGLPVHDAHGGHAHDMALILEETLDLGGVHVHVLLGEREDPAHPDRPR